MIYAADIECVLDICCFFILLKNLVKNKSKK